MHAHRLNSLLQSRRNPIGLGFATVPLYVRQNKSTELALQTVSAEIKRSM